MTDIDFDLLESNPTGEGIYWRRCHVCEHRYDFEYEAVRNFCHDTATNRPALCPRCGAFGGFTSRWGPFIHLMYGVAGPETVVPDVHHCLAYGLTYLRDPGEVRSYIDTVLAKNAIREVDSSIGDLSPDPGRREAFARAVEWVSTDLASGFHEWRIRDIGEQAIADLITERGYHLELLRRREAAGIR